MTFITHNWQLLEESEMADIQRDICHDCEMLRETIEGETTFKVKARTPSGYKTPIIPAGKDWPEPTCQVNLSALGKLLRKKRDKVAMKGAEDEMSDSEVCCVSWENDGQTMWECGGPGICDHDECHFISVELAA